MFANGFQLILNAAWSCLNTVIIPAGSFGDHADITFINCLTLLLGATFLVKFFRLATGGSFNIVRDKPSNRKKDDINNFMHSSATPGNLNNEQWLIDHFEGRHGK